MGMHTRLSRFLVLGLLILATSAFLGCGESNPTAPSPGGLLKTTTTTSTGPAIGITPTPRYEDLAMEINGKTSPATPTGNTKTFRILNGERKGETFEGKHYKSPLYSSYQEQPWNPDEGHAWIWDPKPGSPGIFTGRNTAG